MKKLLLLAIASTFSIGAWADTSCKNKQYTPVPRLQGVDSMEFNDSIRDKLLKSGWRPIPLKGEEKESVFYDPQIPEKYCSATICISSFKDSKNNILTIVMNDFIKEIELKCK